MQITGAWRNTFSWAPVLLIPILIGIYATTIAQRHDQRLSPIAIRCAPAIDIQALRASDGITVRTSLTNRHDSPVTIESVHVDVGCRAEMSSRLLPITLRPGQTTSVDFLVEVERDYVLPLTHTSVKLGSVFQPMVRTVDGDLLAPRPTRLDLVLRNSIVSSAERFSFESKDPGRFISEVFRDVFVTTDDTVIITDAVLEPSREGASLERTRVDECRTCLRVTLGRMCNTWDWDSQVNVYGSKADGTQVLATLPVVVQRVPKVMFFPSEVTFSGNRRFENLRILSDPADPLMGIRQCSGPEGVTSSCQVDGAAGSVLLSCNGPRFSGPQIVRDQETVRLEIAFQSERKQHVEIPVNFVDGSKH